MSRIDDICKAAKENCTYIAAMTAEEKTRAVNVIADSLIAHSVDILKGNAADLKAAEGKPDYFIDRLMLNGQRLKNISDALKEVAKLPDPIGEILESKILVNGLKLEKVRVPLGVVGIIYEARPNVTADAVALCLKSGNSVVLRGSKDAINTNKALIAAIKADLLSNGITPEFIQLVCDTTHQGAETLMKCRRYVDVLIPRGSGALIKSVIEKSSIPVIETGEGNCHAYIENSADTVVATEIILNGKLSRPSVCNALESIVIDRELAKSYLPALIEKLVENQVCVVGCTESVKLSPLCLPAQDGDFSTEFLAKKISVKIVSGVEEAIAHINEHSTKHSEVIITRDEKAAEKFLNEVDSAAVYVNASTRFTDGFEFGMGAEMGISTQKLHARGPMGLRELTTTKYKIYGSGQTRK